MKTKFIASWIFRDTVHFTFRYICVHEHTNEWFCLTSFNSCNYNFNLAIADKYAVAYYYSFLPLFRVVHFWDVEVQDLSCQLFHSAVWVVQVGQWPWHLYTDDLTVKEQRTKRFSKADSPPNLLDCTNTWQEISSAGVQVAFDIRLEYCESFKTQNLSV